MKEWCQLVNVRKSRVKTFNFYWKSNWEAFTSVPLQIVRSIWKYWPEWPHMMLSNCWESRSIKKFSINSSLISARPGVNFWILSSSPISWWLSMFRFPRGKNLIVQNLEQLKKLGPSISSSWKSLNKLKPFIARPGRKIWGIIELGASGTIWGSIK